MKFLFFVSGMLFCNLLTAQTLPNIIPRSPEASAFARYGEIPIDHSTGIPSIEIPIYSIKSGKVDLPISFSYHASGIRVSDIASTTGLGWVLNAGGMISRIVYGQEDELVAFPPPLKSSAAIAQYVANNDIDQSNFVLSDLYNGVWDTQSDRYTYNLPGKVGVFRADFNTGELVPIPYSPTIIKRKKDTPSDLIPFYEIVTEDGTRYVFRDMEISSRHGAPGGNRSWLLSKIISADGIEEVNLYYKADIPFMERLPQTTYTKGLRVYHTDSDPFLQGICVQSGVKTEVIQSYDRSFIAFIHGLKLLDSIVSRNEVVKFTYNDDRQDLRKNRLTSIKILNKQTRSIIKDIDLQHSYFGNTPYSKRLKLNRVIFKNSDPSQNHEQFSFKYNSLFLPEYVNPEKGAQAIFEYYEDYWGYYNGSVNNSMIPKQYLDPVDQANFGGNREPDSAYMKAASLEEITYPTGGRSVFKMEANRDAAENIMGGLRVKQIRNLDSDGKILQTKTYTYNPGSFHYLSQELFKQTEQFVYYGATCLKGGASYGGEWTESGASDTWTGSALFNITVGSGSSVLYQTVTEYNGSEENNTGRTKYFYEIQDFFSFENFPIPNSLFWDIHNFDHADYKPRLIMQIDQKNINGQYLDVVNTQNTYTEVKKYTFSTGFKVGRSEYYINQDPAYMQPIPFGTRFAQYKGLYLGGFGYADTKAYKNVSLLTRTRIAKGDLIEIINYDYDTLTHLQNKKKIFKSSQQDVISTEYKYPSDLKTQASVYQRMIDQNILTPVVEISEFKNASPIQILKTNYKEWFPSIFAPSSVEVKIKDKPIETRIVFHNYDSKGNILNVSKVNNHLISYLWDISFSYPIAEIMGGSAGHYFHTSFESPGEGNSTEFKTGSKSKTDGFVHSLIGLANGQYILSYWSKGSSSWELHMLDVTISDGTYTISISGHVDEVRFAGKGIHFNTWTYEVGKGITSKTDVNNQSVYYDYDGLRRLKSIKDDTGSIIKTIQYHFKD